LYHHPDPCMARFNQLEIEALSAQLAEERDRVKRIASRMESRGSSSSIAEGVAREVRWKRVGGDYAGVDELWHTITKCFDQPPHYHCPHLKLVQFWSRPPLPALIELNPHVSRTHSLKHVIWWQVSPVEAAMASRASTRRSSFEGGGSEMEGGGQPSLGRESIRAPSIDSTAFAVRDMQP
jgi:hypothetical protein